MHLRVTGGLILKTLKSGRYQLLAKLPVLLPRLLLPVLRPRFRLALTLVPPLLDDAAETEKKTFKSGRYRNDDDDVDENGISMVDLYVHV